MNQPQIDVDITNHGSLVLLDLKTPAAREWVDEHISSEATFWGSSLVAEPRYVEDLITGMENDGLTVVF